MAKRNILKTISKDKIQKINIQSSNRPSPQSFCVISSTNRVVIHKHTNERSAEMVRYSSNSMYPNNNKNNWRTTDRVGHANGCTYCAATNEIIATRYRNGGAKKHYVAVFDATTLKHKRDIKLPCKVSGVAYDRITTNFYTSNGGTMHVFTFNNFMKGKSWSKTINVKFKGMWQDIGGFNGVIYKIIGTYHGTNNHIDGYRASDGKYIGSIKVPFYEIESVDVDENYNLHMVSTNTRWLMNTGINVNKIWQGASSAVNANQKVTIPTGMSGGGGTTLNAPAAFVANAKKELGTKESGNNDNKYGKWYGMNHQPWCAIFVCWCAHKTLGDAWTKTFEKSALAFGVGQGVVNKGGKWIKKASRGPTTHVGIVASVKNGKATTVEGNAGDKVSSRSIKVPSGTRMGDLIIFYGGSVGGIARPNWPGGAFYADGMEGVAPEELTLQVSPEQLYSSAQWGYEDQEEQEESKSEKESKENTKAMKDFLMNLSVTNPGYNAIPDVKLVGMFTKKTSTKPQTKVYGQVTGSHLPSTVNYVEAPYVKLTLGGVSIGTYRGGNYPNYINSLSVKKTNGSMNEYTINLIHQIYPGDNPNYIDNLISANGYNKIKIEYGDSESGVAFRNDDALLTGVKSNFDFFNNTISYTLSATSSAIMSAVGNRSYPEVTDKPSNIINKMLFDTKELLEYFPGMENRTRVSSKLLIPTTDKVITIGSVESTTPFGYLTTLVSAMQPVNSKSNAVYFLDIKEDSKKGAYFQIKEVETKTVTPSSTFMYEVDINYPDDNSLVYNFAVNEDFAWPLAYKYSGGFNTYNYNIDNSGTMTSSKTTSNLKNITSTTGVSSMDANWWKNVTEFPIKASLEIKGLSTYVLLLNYIKINVYYFGKKRSSSGVYIVTGQEDSLSGNGFRTRLDLLRVAGDGQYITVDGRVAT